jgi:hypothetical protein
MSNQDMIESITTALTNKTTIEALKPLFHPERDWVDILSQILLPFVSMLVLFYIAYRQWRTDDLRLKHERRMDEANFKQSVFDSRYEVYELVLYFITKSVGGVDLRGTDEEKFFTIRKKSAFLFDKAMKSYIDELYVKIKRIQTLRIGEQKAQPDEREKILDEAAPLLSWLEECKSALKIDPPSASNFDPPQAVIFCLSFLS